MQGEPRAVATDRVQELVVVGLWLLGQPGSMLSTLTITLKGNGDIVLASVSTLLR